MPTEPKPSQDVLRRARKITALVLDVDGVLTDGRMIYDEFGDELKCFDVQDGTGLVLWHRAGFKSAMITGKRTKLVQRRAKDLGVHFLAQKALQKLIPYEQFLRKAHLSHDQVCAIADDLLDIPILRRAGLAIAVPNAVTEVKSVSHYQTQHSGGCGAVREVIELILKSKGQWGTAIKTYYV